MLRMSQFLPVFYSDLPRCKNLWTFSLFCAFCFSRFYCVDFFVFFILRHRWVKQVLTPRMSLRFHKIPKDPHVALQSVSSINLFLLVLSSTVEIGSLSNDENGKKQQVYSFICNMYAFGSWSHLQLLFLSKQLQKFQRVNSMVLSFCFGFVANESMHPHDLFA